MLVVSRKENEWIRIEPVEGLDPELTLRELFADGPIVVRVMHIGRRVRLVIEAPRALKIWRGSRAGADGLAATEACGSTPAAVTRQNASP
jgi:sRNA-binding carbon storage regulator CsrA